VVGRGDWVGAGVVFAANKQQGVLPLKGAVGMGGRHNIPNESEKNLFAYYIA